MTDERSGRNGPTRRAILAGGMGLGALAATRSPARAQVSLQAMIGQMLMIGLSGASASTDSARRLAADIQAGRAGGVIMLGHNFRSRDGALGLARLFREAGGAAKPLVALDQEGGQVQRLSSRLGFTDIPRAARVSDGMSPDEARRLYASAAAELGRAGFNLNLAPVVDLADPNNPVIGRYGRAYGREPDRVTAYARAFLAGHAEAGVGAVLKHFPGHGLSRGDSHDSFVDITATWDEDEIAPFRDLIASGDARAVMPGHLYHARLSENGEPVSLSRPAIEGMLRSRLGFSGLVVTDDLDMAAVRARYPLDEAVVKAVAAGNDIVMLSNSARPDPDLARRMIDVIGGAVEAGRVPRAKIEASHQRITRFKAALA